MVSASSQVTFPVEGLWKSESSVKEAFQINREYQSSALGHSHVNFFYLCTKGCSEINILGRCFIAFPRNFTCILNFPFKIFISIVESNENKHSMEAHINTSPGERPIPALSSLWISNHQKWPYGTYLSLPQNTMCHLQICFLPHSSLPPAHPLFCPLG